MDDIITIQTNEKKKKAPFVAGVVILVLAVIGLVNVVGWVAEIASPGKKGDTDYEEYAQYLTWVVGVDPAPFSDISKADKDALRNIAICSLLNDGTTTDTYEVTDKGLMVPAKDVERVYYSMFGSENPIVHANVVGYGYEFTYDVGKEIYYVPITGVSPAFAVRIESVKKTGGVIQLRVGYVGVSSVEVSADGTLEAVQPDKYADITLKEAGDTFNLISVMTVTAGEYQ